MLHSLPVSSTVLTLSLKVSLHCNGGLVQRDMVNYWHLHCRAEATSSSLLGDSARQVGRRHEDADDYGLAFREDQLGFYDKKAG